MNNCNQTKPDGCVLDYLQIDGKLYPVLEIEDDIKSLEPDIKAAKDGIRCKVDELIRKKTYLREDSLKKQFNRFIALQSETVKKAVYLNNALLHLVVRSYYDDIHRFKDYSGSMWANRHKQAAYTIKWIVRFKPVQIRQEFDNEKYIDNEILDINLTFALMCGFSFLDRKVIDLISSEKKEVDTYNLSLSSEKKESEKRESFYDKLLYDLRYRPFSGKQMISIFEALELRTLIKF